ncbi:MAG: NUDIX domain-containing protein [Bacteroidota bacterium]
MSDKNNIHLAVDAVVFGYQPQKGISVLLIERKYPPFEGSWAIPGGFVLERESLEEAVTRELAEETGVKITYLEQLYTFGKPDRDPRKRIVAVAYFALVRPEGFSLSADTDASDAKWFSIDELPPLAFDHDQILEVALTRLRGKILYEPIGFELLDEKFPFSSLHQLYETVLGGSIDRRNFKKKFLKLGLVEELNEQRKQAGSGRPARLYRFNEERYFGLKQTGNLFELWLPSGVK